MLFRHAGTFCLLLAVIAASGASAATPLLSTQITVRTHRAAALLHDCRYIVLCCTVCLMLTPACCDALQTPVTVPLGAGMRSNSSFLNLTDPTLAGANATGNTPTQVTTWSNLSAVCTHTILINLPA